MTFSGISFVTILPAQIIVLSPIFTPGRIQQLPPIHTFLPMITDFPNSTSFNLSCVFDEWQAV